MSTNVQQVSSKVQRQPAGASLLARKLAMWRKYLADEARWLRAGHGDSLAYWAAESECARLAAALIGGVDVAA